MGWYSIGGELLGGDAPLDAYGLAMMRVAKAWKKALKRLPTLAEIVLGFDAPIEPSATFDALERASRAEERPRTTAKRLETGELLAVPYDDGRAIVALVLFGEERTEKGPGYGPCVVPLDLAPDEIVEPDRVRTARWLTLPFHPGRRWKQRRVGRVRLEPDAGFLPTFVWYSLPGSTSKSAMAFAGYERKVYDYFGAEITGDRTAELRAVPPVIGGTGIAIVSIRAALGLNRELPWSRIQRPDGAEPTPLAHLARLEAVPPKPKRGRAKAPAEPTAALVELLATELTKARAECEAAWRDAAERSPTREELASALANVLGASADDFTADPSRIEQIDRPQRAASAPVDARDDDAITFRQMHGVEQIVVGPAARPRWTAYPFREDGHLVVETFDARDRAPAMLPRVLAAWRAHHGLPDVPEPVTWRPMDWGTPQRLDA